MNPTLYRNLHELNAQTKSQREIDKIQSLQIQGRFTRLHSNDSWDHVDLHSRITDPPMMDIVIHVPFKSPKAEHIVLEGSFPRIEYESLLHTIGSQFRFYILPGDNNGWAWDNIPACLLNCPVAKLTEEGWIISPIRTVNALIGRLFDVANSL